MLDLQYSQEQQQQSPELIVKDINQKHLKLSTKKDTTNPNLYKQLVPEAQALIREIRLSGRMIENINHRQRLESYAGYWGLFIFENTNIYPNTSLLEFETDQGSTPIVWEFDKNKIDRQLARVWKFDKNTIDRQQARTFVFHEEFTYRDVSISLGASRLNAEGNPIEDLENLEEWVKKELDKSVNQERVILLEGERGQGKTFFCLMLADLVGREMYDKYTPILIETQAIKSLESDFSRTLTKNFSDRDLVAKNKDWLKDENNRFLFLLDGLDDLAIENHPERSLETFLKQAVKFCRDSEFPKHRILITSRPSFLEQIFAQSDIKQQILPHLDIVKIKPFDEGLQEKWIDTKWQNIVGENTAKKFKDFWRNHPATKKLAQEPLLLYLLAAMHRDRQLEDLPKDIREEEARSCISETMLNWVIRDQKQLPYRIRKKISNEKKEIQEKNETEFKRILAEAGLCALQSGGIRTTMNLLHDRLTNRGNELAEWLIQHPPEQKEPGRTVLGNFSSDPASDTGGSVEFNHKSFCEFLYARRLLDSLADWTKKWNDFTEFELRDQENIKRDDREEFVIPLDRMDWEIYDLLGFGRLTPEIVEYLKAYLNFSKEFVKKRLERLFKRLKNFYSRWFQGDFINKEYSQTLAQRKMLQLQKSLEAQGLFLGRRQIDIYTGLNVLILLLEIHRQLVVLHSDTLNTEDIPTFYPCGKPLPHCTDVCDLQSSPTATEAEGEFAPSRILRIISYCRWLDTEVFVKTVGSFLEGINLRSADLRGAELYGVKLNNAYLSDATLNGINLSGAELNQAFLGSAKLCRANLNNTQLNSAFLGNADLSGAFLGNAILKNAVLTGANLRTALLVNANLTGTYFGDADLSDANLRNAILKNADLSCVNLQDVNLRGANLTNAKLMSADLRGANLKYADLTSADLRGADLRNANLTEATLMKTNLKGADLTGAIVMTENLKDAELDETTKGIEQLFPQAGNEPENSENKPKKKQTKKAYNANL